VSDRSRPNPFPPPPPKSEPPRTQTPAQGGGFAARLQDASLWDLIQFECMRRSRRIVRVTSRGLLGYVFFRDGDVVHATTGRQNGEAALGEMLSWQDGVFETWTGTWPDRETINTPWQRVLLEVAQAKDEARAPKVLSFPPREAAKGPKDVDSIPPDSASSLPPPRPAPIESVTVSPDGKVVRGSAHSELPEAAAYAMELADLIGDCLGLDALRALEADFETAHFLVGRASDGNIVAARAAQPGELEALKKELGL
jgi:uncharacterized protein DUF4388